MAEKRMVRGEKYDVAQLVRDAMAAAEPDLELAKDRLRQLGHADPVPELVERYARDRAVLTELERMTGAAFSGQIGKIGFDNVDIAIRQVNAYLDRRNAGHRSRWGK